MERLSCEKVRPFSHATAVDGKPGVMSGVKIMQAGDVNDSRPFTVDDTTLEQIAELGNQPNKGIRSRVTHPSMCNDGMGSHLGRAKNFRVDGDAVYADLHFAESAKNSPKGDYVTYVQELAEEDPEALGMSVVVEFTEEMEEALEGNAGSERVPMRVSRLRAADVVDEPAATRGGMFGDFQDFDIAQLEDPAFAALVSNVLETRFKGLSAEEVSAKIADFLSKQYGESILDTENQTPPADPQSDAPEQGGHVRFVEQFGDRGAALFLEGKSFEECLQAQIVELQAQIEGLTAENKSLSVKIEAALLASGGNPDDPIDPAPEPEELSEEDKAKQKRDAELSELRKQGLGETSSRWARGFGKKKSD